MTKPKLRHQRYDYGPVTPINTHELAWTAGFFDGEGTVGTRANGRNGNRRITVNIGQKDLEVLQRFQTAVGVGNIHRRASGISCWETSVREFAHRVMWMLWPWLGTIKREQFDRACEAYHAWPMTRGGE